jgi:hypothetical protein
MRIFGVLTLVLTLASCTGDRLSQSATEAASGGGDIDRPAWPAPVRYSGANPHCRLIPRLSEVALIISAVA